MNEGKKTAVKDKFLEGEYPIHVVGRHVDITDAMRSYAVEKLKKIQRFGGRVLEVTIIMDIQKLVHCVDFIILVNNTKIKVSGKTETMYSAIDQAVDRLETKVRRYHKRLTEHHAKGVKSAPLNVNIIQMPIRPLDDINDQIDEENLRRVEEELRPHPISRKETIAAKFLNQEEAIMKIELSGDPFMVYMSEEDHKLKVIYRCDDGNYGIIEPQ